MLITPHAVAGATIGALLPNPLLAIPVAIGSHFILDSIPHWQETLAPYTPTRKTYIRIPFDAALALGLIALITHWHPESVSLIWICAAFANAPDLDTIVIIFPHLKRGLVEKFWDFHCKIQLETSSLWGVVTQVVLVAGCLVAASS